VAPASLVCVGVNNFRTAQGVRRGSFDAYAEPQTMQPRIASAPQEIFVVKLPRGK